MVYYKHITPAGCFLIRVKTLHYMSTIVEYLKETKEEMKHVTWPTRNQAVFFTVAVLAVSALIAYYLGFFDYLFAQGLERLITR